MIFSVITQSAKTASCSFILLGVLSGCATTMEAGSHCTVETDFLQKQRTFTWGPDGAVDLIDESGYISPAIVAQLKKRVIRELNFKGLRLIESPTPEEAVDLTVELYLRARREVVSRSAYGTLQGPCTHPDCGRGPHPNNLPIDIRTTGFLAADVYYQGEPIWRGWVERLLYPSERDQAAAVINEAVPVLFEKFPP